jgi:hypothetical protein
VPKVLQGLVLLHLKKIVVLCSNANCYLLIYVKSTDRLKFRNLHSRGTHPTLVWELTNSVEASNRSDGWDKAGLMNVKLLLMEECVLFVSIHVRNTFTFDRATSHKDRCVSVST